VPCASLRQKRESSLRAVSLVEFDVWCVAAPQYLHGRGTPTRLEDLASPAWIAFTLIPHPRRFQTRDGKQSVWLHRLLRTTSSAGGRVLAVAGAGIFAAPSFVLVPELAAARLVRVLPELELPQVTVCVARPGSGEPPPKTRAFIDLAKAQRGPHARL
jgi:DNA-binding transcriptional LysR family regulator